MILNNGIDLPRSVMERDNLCCRLWLKAVQPVKEIHQHLQCILFNGLYHFVKVLSHPPVRSILHFEIVLQERDRIVEEEMWSGFEELWDGVLGEIEVYGARDISE